MTPVALQRFLENVLQHDLRMSLMIWGPPGIGKSSIVAEVAAARELDLVDVRLSQLAPTDLRGLPVPRDDDRSATWYAPDFLPREGQGVLFLDEVNMAAPTVQGIAQQLILDRKVGSYTLPDGWYIWAAGNRKEDRAAVFDMPAPVANRFIHLDVAPDLESFRRYALREGLHEHIQAFLSFRPELLFNMSPDHPAWPSPRSWEMASWLYSTGEPALDLATAIGEGPAGEFYAYLDIYDDLPDFEKILTEDTPPVVFPEEPSKRYAITTGLSVRAENAEQALRGFVWMGANAPDEFTQLYAQNVLPRLRQQGEMGRFIERAQGNGTVERLQRAISAVVAHL